MQSGCVLPLMCIEVCIQVTWCLMLCLTCVQEVGHGCSQQGTRLCWLATLPLYRTKFVLLSGFCNAATVMFASCWTRGSFV